MHVFLQWRNFEELFVCNLFSYFKKYIYFFIWIQYFGCWWLLLFFFFCYFSVRSIVALNLHNYGSGRNPWGHPNPKYMEKVLLIGYHMKSVIHIHSSLMLELHCLKNIFCQTTLYRDFEHSYPSVSDKQNNCKIFFSLCIALITTFRAWIDNCVVCITCILC